jgi:hypothetical protein
MNLSEVDDRALLESLASTVCPACAGKKKRRETFCSRDYYQLPREDRRALYGTVASGRYRPAVLSAMKTFNLTEFHMPPEPEPARQP